MQNKIKRILGTVLRIVITAGLLWFLFKKIDFVDTLADVKSANKWLLLFSFLIYAGIYILGFFRWNMLLKAAGIEAPFKKIIRSFAGGVFFSMVLPSTIGGDLVRSVDLAAHTKKGKEVVATVLLDRLSGYVGLVIVALTAVIFGREYIVHKSVGITLAIIIGVLIAVLLVLFNSFIYKKINKFLDRPNAGKIRETIRNLHEEIHYFRNKKMMIIKNLFLSFIIQLIIPVSFYLTGLAIGVKINLLYYLIFLPIIGAITLLPISIGGFGVRENITISFFGLAGVAADKSGSMSLINDFFILVFVLAGGVIYVLTLRNRRVQRSQASQLPQQSKKV